MSSAEHRVGDHEVRMLIRRVERHNGGDPAKLEFDDIPVRRVVSIPQAGPVRSVALCVGTRRFVCRVIVGDYDDATLLRAPRGMTCFADGKTLTIVPYLPFPDARVHVEYADAG